MNEQNGMTPNETLAPRRDAIEIQDFVFAATGARVRRLTTATGDHWFVAADVASKLGYANTRQALAWHVAPECTRRLNEIASGVCTATTLGKLAAHRLQKSMRMVNLPGLIALVNGCTKPEAHPFKTWVCEVIATIQREGSYSLGPDHSATAHSAPAPSAPARPAPVGAPAYALPAQVADAIVRLEERNIRADEMLVAFQREQVRLLREISHSQGVMAEALRDIADARRSAAPEPASPAPPLTPRRLLATWKARNLVVADDVHAVAAYLAPALVRGEARHAVAEIGERTGLPQERVHDCLRMLIKRGCVRQAGCSPEGVPVYVLP